MGYHYSAEFRREVIAEARGLKGKDLERLARDKGITAATIRNWLRAEEQQGHKPPPPALLVLHGGRKEDEAAPSPPPSSDFGAAPKPAGTPTYNAALETLKKFGRADTYLGQAALQAAHLIDTSRSMQGYAALLTAFTQTMSAALDGADMAGEDDPLRRILATVRDKSS